MRNRFLLALKSLVAFGFIAGLLWWADAHIEWADMWSAWQRLSVSALLGATAMVLFSHGMRVIRVHFAYAQQYQLGRLDVAGVSLVHNTISFLLPMRLGEAALPILSRTRLNVGISYSSATLLMLRVFDAHWLLVLLLIFASQSYLGQSAALISWALVLSMPLVLWALRRWLMQSARFSTIKALVRRPRTLIILYVQTGMIWGVKLAALAYLASVLGLLPLDHAWIATIIADASALSPVTGFANAGTFEAAFSLPLLPLNYDASSLVETALNVHIFILVTNIAAGLVGAIMLLVKPKQPDNQGTL